MPALLPKNGRTLTRNGAAIVTEADGSIADTNATGIFTDDQRVVRGLTFLIDGRPPVLLAGARTGPATDVLTYGVWGDEPDPVAIVVRERHLDVSYSERYSLQCFRRPVDLALEVKLTAGAALVYELGNEPASTDDTWLHRSLISDSMRIDGTELSATVQLRPGARRAIDWSLQLARASTEPLACQRLTSTDPRLVTAWERAHWDLEALTMNEPTTGLPFVTAGSPHFLAVFGRDALTVALLTMVTGTERAMATLQVLAAHQGTRSNATTLEEAGRIFHELRVGKMGVFGLEPGTPYYGSVDATPLFVVVMAECLRWGAPADQLAPLLPAARAAVEWCRTHTDKFGFVQSVPHDSGIDNQGWKDSGDAIVRANGSVYRGATSLVEVQGHVHEALLGLAELEEAVGHPDAGPSLRQEAADFKDRFLAHFVVEPPVHVALALDEEGLPIATRASNVGHLLAGALVDDDLAARLADRLLDSAEFSGWGLRTLAATEAAYNPLGYHTGSVWPHDTALLLRGLSQRGLVAQSRALAAGLLDLADRLDYELPELLGGFDRATFPAPIPYPASARPQAWAASVPIATIAALLGIQPELHKHRVTIRPVLPGDVSLSVQLEIGGRALQVDAHGDDVTVEGDTDGLTILTGEPPP
jgi:glycogen debranching enzyme